MKVTHILCVRVSETLPLSSFQECFNSPYGTQYFADYAETIPGTTTEHLSSVAKECKIYLIGGEEFASERTCSTVTALQYVVVCILIDE